MSLILTLIKRDLVLALRHGGSAWLPLGFFVIVSTVFGFSIGPDTALLGRLAPGLIWVAALLAVLISLDRMFQGDFEDGTLDLLRLSPMPLGSVVMAKIAAHWLSTGLPLIVATPLLALELSLPAHAFPILFLSLVIGTPSFSLIGAIGAALTVSLRRGGLIIPLLILPLYIPILIFGVSAVDAALVGMSPWPHIKLLGATFLMAAVLGPVAGTAALKMAAD
jgi:heme exporter protein B